ncbi:MAG TPA: acylneuraminate cytidylyltransferase family protein [Lentimicrobium sp.]|nr:acylneuraminate cytidylyltransferase family protein [Lentimicrobium sp.]
MKTLFIIPARAGSKGIVKKNVRVLGGKPLIVHSLDVARKFVDDSNICVSTDDPDVIAAVENEKYTVPFVRPMELATDNTGMREVLLHAIDHYAKAGMHYDRLVLLQPTSPFRQYSHVEEALSLYNNGLDMVVSVAESKANPYFVLYEENTDGILVKSKTGNFTSRQDCPAVYQLNGAIYVINIKSLKEKPIAEFRKIKKVLMDQLHSVDLDTEIDWKLAVLLNEEYKIV